MSISRSFDGGYAWSMLLDFSTREGAVEHVRSDHGIEPEVEGES